MIKNLRINNLSKLIFPLKNLSKKTRRRILLGSIFVVLILAPIVAYSLTHLQKSEAAWFNNNWGFRKTIPVTSTEGAVQNNVFVSFTLDTASLITAGKLQGNCQDIRITDINGKLLKYHVGRVTACNNASTSIDFLLSSFPNGQSTYYVYYGNPSTLSTDAGSLTVSQANASTVTASGNEITDVTRATATQGDGLYPSATNLVPNGGFETNTTGWAGSATRSTTNKKFGTASSLWVPTGAYEMEHTAMSISSITAGSTYTFSAWVYRSGTSDTFTLQMLSESYGGIASVVIPAVVGWQRVSVSGIPASGGQTHAVLAFQDGAVPTESIYIDGVQAELGSVATDYIETDGGVASRYPDSSYGIWQGATNIVTNGGFEGNTNGWSAMNSTGSSDNTTSKFGSKSGKAVVTSTSSPYGFAYFNLITGSPLAQNTYSMNLWFKAPAGKTFQIQLNETGGSHGDSVVGNTAIVYPTATGVWQKVTMSGTITYADRTSLYSLIQQTTGGGTSPGDSFYMDGVQIEQSSIATPYVETNGGTVARSAARVQGSPTSLNSTQGWIAMRVKLYSSTNGYFFLFGADVNNRINAWADFTYNRIYIEKIDGAANFSNTVTTGDLRNTTATIIVKWTKSRMDLSANGGAFNGFTTTAAPITGTSFDIGSGGTIIPTSNFNGNILWTIAGSGTLTDTDASTLNGYGNTDPSTNQLAGLNGGIANPTLLWTADTTADTQTTYSQGPARNYTIGTLASEENGAAPVLSFKFDEGTGTSTTDSSSNKIKGTFSANPTWKSESECVSGKCLYFDGSNTANNQTVVFSQSSTSPTNLLGDVTMSAWIKPTSNYFDTSEAILRNGQGLDEVYSMFYDAVNKRPYVEWYDGAFKSAVGTTNSIPLNSWSHLEIVRNGTTISFYVNGIFTNSATVTAPTVAASQFAIGRTNNAGVPQDYTGYLDDLKIYSYARTTAQIKTDYSSRGSVKGVSTSIGASNANQNLSNGLIGFWKMDEATNSWNGTAGEVIDSSGNSNNGTGSGFTSSSPTTGKFGNGGYFDGSNDVTNVTSSTSNSLSNSITASAWVKYTSFVGTDNEVIGKYSNAGGSTGWILFRSTASYENGCTTNKLCFVITPPSTGFSLGQNMLIGSSTTVAPGTWYHVVATYDYNTNQIKIYVNGVLENTITRTGSSGIATNALAVSMGGNPGDNNRYMNGNLDDVRLYNRALSSAEVQQLYNYAPPPIAYYNFEEGSGNSVNDSSGNGNTGTWNGTGSHWAQGKYGKGGTFNATDDLISIQPNTSYLNQAFSAITVEAWVYPTSFVSGSYGPRVISNTDGNGWAMSVNNGYLTVDFRLSGGAVISQYTTAALTLNAWNHIVLTYSSSSGLITGYLNGVSLGTVVGNGIITQTPTTCTFIGSEPATCSLQAGSEFPFPGKIDEVKIYNYARTQKQIVSDMNASHPSVGSPVGSALGFWKFDEGYGNVAHNSGSGGSNYNAVLAASTATPTWTQDGKFGKALTFDGINDYASAPMGSGTITNQVSISMWIKFNNLSSQQNFFSLYDSSVNRYVPYKSPGNQLLCWDNNETLNSNVTVVVGRWYHYVCTSDGSKLSIYVDGQLKNSTSTSFALANNAQTTYFGSDAGGVNLNGSLDEVKIYNYALTADEIKLDYNHGSSQVLGSMSDTSGLAGGSVASNSASAAYCTPGDTSTCSSPVGEWNFEEGNGNSVNDSSGNGLIGTMTNGATWTSGKLGKAGNFNGASVRQGVQVSNNALLNPGTGSFTTEAWIKTTQTGNAKRITTKRGSSSTWFSMYIYNGLLAFETAVSYPSYYTVGTGNKIINNGQWHHVVMVRDTSQSKILLYVDGALDVSPTDNTAGQSITNSEIFEIGIWGTEAYDTGSYTGKIDQVRMFNYARTPAQIAYDYNRGAPVGYWKFDECQGTTLNDSSGNGNNGTIIIGATGSQTTAGTCLTPTDGTGAWYNGASGKFNASLKFDGNDDYATLTSTPTTGTGSFSIFGWVKTSSTGTRKQILAYGSDSSNNGEWVFINTSNQVESDLSTVAGPNSAVTVTDGNWHFVGVVNNTNTFQIYVDGKASGNSSSMSPNIGTGNTPVIGSGMGGNAGGWRFNGQIDDLRVYNYALTASQIKQVMNQGAGVRFGPLTGTP